MREGMENKKGSEEGVVWGTSKGKAKAENGIKLRVRRSAARPHFLSHTLLT